MTDHIGGGEIEGGCPGLHHGRNKVVVFASGKENKTLIGVIWQIYLNS